MDQEEEYRMMAVERDIVEHLTALYILLQCSDDPKAEEHLGHIAEMKAYWEGDSGSVDGEGADGTLTRR